MIELRGSVWMFVSSVCVHLCAGLSFEYGKLIICSELHVLVHVCACVCVTVCVCVCVCVRVSVFACAVVARLI